MTDKEQHKKINTGDRSAVNFWMEVYEAAPTPEKAEQLKQCVEVYVTTVELLANKHAKKIVEGCNSK